MTRERSTGTREKSLLPIQVRKMEMEDEWGCRPSGGRKQENERRHQGGDSKKDRRAETNIP